MASVLGSAAGIAWGGARMSAGASVVTSSGAVTWIAGHGAGMSEASPFPFKEKEKSTVSGSGVRFQFAALLTERLMRFC